LYIHPHLANVSVYCRFPHLWLRHNSTLPLRLITFFALLASALLFYVRLHREFVYRAVLLDVFTRGIRGWYLGRSLSQELTLSALQRALAQRLPEIHHSDQGVQYAATGYVQLLEEAGVRISMAEVGQAWQNGYAERIMRTIKEEEVDLSEYQDYWDAYWQMGQLLEDVYMKKRIHSSLGYLTPVEFENQWLAQQGVPEVVH
jgi:putative transposase